MPVSLSIKNVPEALAARLRLRAERHHRSLQGELMAILEEAATESWPAGADTVGLRVAEAAPRQSLVDRLIAIAGGRGIDVSKRLSRDQAHDRKSLRKASV